MSPSESTYRIDRRAGQQGSRPSVRGQAEVEKFVTGHHYSEVASSGWPTSKRQKTPKTPYTSKVNCKPRHNRHAVSFGSINTTTMKDPLKLIECLCQCKKLNQQITFFQETHITGNQTIKFDNHDQLNGWTFINCGFKAKAYGGVGIALSPGTRVLDIDNAMNGRILLIRAKVSGIRLSLVSAYAPCEDKSESMKQLFYNNLRQTLKKVKKNYPSYKLLIGADMNATIGNESNNQWTYLGKFNDDLPTNDNGTRTLSFCQDFNLFILNSLFAMPAIHRHTWYSPTGFSKRIDYIMAEWHIKRSATNCRVYRGASIPFESNHRMLALYCNFPSKRLRQNIIPRTQKNSKPYPNIKLLKTASKVQETFSSGLDNHLSDTIDTTDVDALESIITTAIETVTSETIPSTERKNETNPWANDTYISLIDERKLCKDPARREDLGKEIKKRRMILSNSYYSKKADEINYASECRNVEEEFRLAKQYKMLKSTEINIIPPEKLTEFFKDHLSQRHVELQPEVSHPSEFPHILPDHSEIITDTPPTSSEVQSAVKSFKNGKCRGTDKVSPEQLKYNNSHKVLLHITILLVTIWTTFKVPSTWLVSSITCLFKNKGSRAEAKNYRGISIMATCSKILSAIIINRIRVCYEKLISNSQFGFRSNKSTSDAIFVLRKTIEINSCEFYCCFIDLKAAYDWINRDMLFKVLEIRLQSPIIVKILRMLYTGTTAAIKHTTTLFQTFTGCRQGGMESPIIFNIYLDFVLHCAEKAVLERYPNTGLKYSFRFPNHCSSRDERKIHGLTGFQRLRMLLYADDIVLLCTNILELEDIVRIYDETFARFGLVISTDKTETMAFNTTEEIASRPSLISIRNVNLKNVRKFKYLGDIITNFKKAIPLPNAQPYSEELTTDHENYLTFRIASAFQKWNELKHVLIDKRIKITTRIRFLEACVRSRLLYSVQTWDLKAHEKLKLETIWHGFLRKMVTNGYKRKNAPKHKKKGVDPATQVIGDLDWSFKYSNEDIHNITKTMPISEFCGVQHLKYIAHVIRLPNFAIQKQLLFTTERKKFSRDPWLKIETMLGLSTMQIQTTMRNKKEFMSLICNRYQHMQKHS